MLKNVIEAITTKLVIALLLFASSITFVYLSHSVNRYSDSNAAFSSKLDSILIVIEEVRQSRFKNQLRFLSSQVYKMNKSPENIRPMDITHASDFCVSTLFNDHKELLKGSERVKVMRDCNQVDYWVAEQDA